MCIHGFSWPHVIDVDTVGDSGEQPGDPGLVRVMFELALEVRVARSGGGPRQEVIGTRDVTGTWLRKDC